MQHLWKSAACGANYYKYDNISSSISILIKKSVCACVCTRHYGLPMASRALKLFL